MPKPRSNVLAHRASEPVKNQTLFVVAQSSFQPLGFFVWGVTPGTFIRNVTIGAERVGWVRGRSALLFVPALPYHLIRELAQMDRPGVRDFEVERYQAFPVAAPGEQLAVEFEGVAQEVAFWGTHLEGTR